MELKYPEFYSTIGFNMGDMILSVLTDANYPINNTMPNLFNDLAPIVIECFIPQTLMYLRNKCNLPLVQLIGKASTYVCTFKHVYICIHICICMYKYIYMYKHMNMCIHIHTNIYV
jgi:hypothetical protein